MGKNQAQITHSDCLTFLKSVADNSVDLIATDPPYFNYIAAQWDRQWQSEADFLHWLEQVVVEYKRVLKPSGSLYLFASSNMAAKVECLIARHFDVLNHIVWSKTTGYFQKANKESLRRYFPRTERIIFAEQQCANRAGKNAKHKANSIVFEPIRKYLHDAFLASGVSRKDIEKACGNQMHGHWFSKSQWTLPSEKHYKTLQLLFNDKLDKSYDDVKQQFKLLKLEHAELLKQQESLRRYFSVNKDIPFTDVWHFNPTPAKKGRHPCQKPMPLMEHIINVSSKPDDLVLDTFVGSGSTAIAAIKNGRRFIGCEKGEHEYKQAIDRLAEL